MSPMRKLAIVVAVQFTVLFSMIGFKQYTVWTGETVLLRTAPLDPRDLLRGDYVTVRYEISRIDGRRVLVDGDVYGSVYVELQRDEDGYWRAVAIHDSRRRSFSRTVVIKGHARYTRSAALGYDAYDVRYGIEDIFVPESSARALPAGPGHTVAVEAKVDRFGNAVPRRFYVDGTPFELHRR